MSLFAKQKCKALQKCKKLDPTGKLKVQQTKHFLLEFATIAMQFVQKQTMFGFKQNVSRLENSLNFLVFLMTGGKVASTKI